MIKTKLSNDGVNSTHYSVHRTYLPISSERRTVDGELKQRRLGDQTKQASRPKSASS